MNLSFWHFRHLRVREAITREGQSLAHFSLVAPIRIPPALRVLPVEAAASGADWALSWVS